MDKQKIIAELRRVAELLQTSHLSQRQFAKNSRISLSTIKYTFGTWKEALNASGLNVGLRKQSRLDDDVYLREIIRLTQELGKKPTVTQLTSKGQFSEKPYRIRWGTFNEACRAAYAKYGFPQMIKVNSEELKKTNSVSTPTQQFVPQTFKPTEPQRRKRVQFGEPIDFRGLRFAPINEQGVVYLFGMVSRELGFLIESIRTDYPDCEGKRCVESKKQRWEHVLIEFEYKSSDFKEHGHRPEGCDLIVCWIHDWKDCPIEVLELRSQIKYLP